MRMKIRTGGGRGMRFRSSSSSESQSSSAPGSCILPSVLCPLTSFLRTMATPTTSVRDYCTLLAKSKLLPADEVEGLSRRWRDETRAADDQVDEFRKYLTSRRYLTEWQAHMVQRGRADGFCIGG